VKRGGSMMIRDTMSSDFENIDNSQTTKSPIDPSLEALPQINTHVVETKIPKNRIVIEIIAGLFLLFFGVALAIWRYQSNAYNSYKGIRSVENITFQSPPTSIILDIPPTNGPVTIDFTSYTNSVLNFTIQHPRDWELKERYEVDTYEEKKTWGWRTISHLPSDRYSEIIFSDPKNNNITSDVLDEIKVIIYQNPQRLNLQDYFKGYYMGGMGVVGDNPNDTSYSSLILKDGRSEQVGKYDSVMIPDRSWSDMANAKTRIYFLSHDNKIYVLEFSYKSFLNIIPKEVEDQIQQIIINFSLGEN